MKISPADASVSDPNDDFVSNGRPGRCLLHQIQFQLRRVELNGRHCYLKKRKVIKLFYAFDQNFLYILVRGRKPTLRTQGQTKKTSQPKDNLFGPKVHGQLTSDRYVFRAKLAEEVSRYEDAHGIQWRTSQAPVTRRGLFISSFD